MSVHDHLERRFQAEDPEVPGRPMRRALRRSPILILAASLLWATAIPAAEPKATLRGPASAGVGDPILLNPTGTVSDEEPSLVLAKAPANVSAEVVPLYGKDGRLLYGMASVPEVGVYTFAVVARGKADGAVEPRFAFGFWEVAVGAVPPTPVPIPPGPGPGPSPTPTPTPVPAEGLTAVIFAYESSAVPPAYGNVLRSQPLRTWMNRKVLKAEDGRPAWRFWDFDVDASRDSPTLRDVWAGARSSFPPDRSPTLLIVQGREIRPFPLPKTELDTLKLLQTYGGE